MFLLYGVKIVFEGVFQIYGNYMKCGNEVPGMILFHNLIIVKTCLYIFQLAPIMTVH
jgi:hypothetical protein